MRAANNFNLLRAIAATLVVVSHAFELPTGAERHDAMYYISGHAISWYAVSAFFVISGYLIAASWERCPSLASFAWARVLRIYPALFVMLILTVPALGMAFSSLQPLQFLTDHRTLLYLLGCLSIVHVQYELPGVFESSPLHAVNGSLWTLRYEVICYAGVALAGSFGPIRSPNTRALLLTATTVISSFLMIYLDASGIHQPGSKLAMLYELGRLVMCFSLGALYYLNLEKKLLLTPYILAALVALMIGARGTPLFAPVANVTTAYCTIWLAFVPNAKWLLWTRSAPDYSYGIYIYAFPIQQALIAAVPSISPAANFAFGLAITTLLAAMSWHLIEKPALSYKWLITGSVAAGAQPITK